MNFRSALSKMKEGYDVKLPSWSGFWRWEDDSVIMYTKNHEQIPLLVTNRPEYTFNNLASEDFEIATTQNSPILRDQKAATTGESSDEHEKIKNEGSMTMKTADGMSFKEALRKMKEGIPVKLPNWKGYWEWEKDGVTMHTEKFRIRHLTNVFLLKKMDDLCPKSFVVATPENCPIMEAQPMWDKLQKQILAEYSAAEREHAEGYLKMLLLLDERVTGDRVYNANYVKYCKGALHCYQPEQPSTEVETIPWDMKTLTVATEQNCLALALETMAIKHMTGDLEGARRVFASIPDPIKMTSIVMQQCILPLLLVNCPEDNFIGVDDINKLPEGSNEMMHQKAEVLDFVDYEKIAKLTI